MRTRAALGGVFASLGILAIGWQVGSATAPSPTISEPAASSSTSGTTAVDGSSSKPSPSAAPSVKPSHDGTFTGDSIRTRYGDVQVEITVSNGTLADVAPLRLTDKGGKSVRISNRAAPLLRSEVLTAGSADVSTVSGATYTSEAYLTSLQSALDQAGL